MESDMIISMGKNHKKLIKDHFGNESILFNKLAYNKNTGILDLEEEYPSLKKMNKSEEKKQKEYEEWSEKVVDYIYRSTPRIAKEIMKN